MKMQLVCHTDLIVEMLDTVATKGAVYDVISGIDGTISIRNDHNSLHCFTTDPEDGAFFGRWFDLVIDSGYNTLDDGTGDAPMGIGGAKAALLAGKKVARKGWNGKDMWLAYVKPSDWNIPVYHHAHAGLKKLPWIGMKTADDSFVPWLASQTDILAEDYVIVE